MSNYILRIPRNVLCFCIFVTLWLGGDWASTRQGGRGNLTGNAIENGTSSDAVKQGNSFHENATTQGNLIS